MNLVEVMVVIAIILILATLLAAGVMAGWKQFQVDATVLTMGRVDGDMLVYEVKHGRRPTRSADASA